LSKEKKEKVDGISIYYLLQLGGIRTASFDHFQDGWTGVRSERRNNLKPTSNRRECIDFLQCLFWPGTLQKNLAQ
jgi:hypothetical protein